MSSPRPPAKPPVKVEAVIELLRAHLADVRDPNYLAAMAERLGLSQVLEGRPLAKPVWLRFQDLKTRGIIGSWPLLRRRIEHDGFPTGIMLGANTRAWLESEVDAWLASRPTAGPEPRGAAKARRDQARRDARKATHPEAEV
jgi:hypothetical protein